YTLNTKITKETEKICDELKMNDELIINSPGGSLPSSIKLANCIYFKDIKVKLKQGFSGAAHITLAAKKICFISESSVIGLHSPIQTSFTGRRSEYTGEQMREFLRSTMRLFVGFDYTVKEAAFIVAGIVLHGPDDLGYLKGKYLKDLLGDRYVGIC
ncbi:unnamed protein product, partial [marine sediment metagenome]